MAYVHDIANHLRGTVITLQDITAQLETLLNGFTPPTPPTDPGSEDGNGDDTEGGDTGGGGSGGGGGEDTGGGTTTPPIQPPTEPPTWINSALKYSSKTYTPVAGQVYMIPVTNEQTTFVEILKFNPRDDATSVAADVLSNADPAVFNIVGIVKFTETTCTLENPVTVQTTEINGVQGINLTQLFDGYEDWAVTV